MNTSMKINNAPNIHQLNELEGWLKSEYDNTKEGFYCNWDTIKKSYQRQQLITCSTDAGIVGFVSWSTGCENGYVEIDIFEKHPNFRKRGYGKQLYKLAETYFKSEGFKVIILFCEPRESEPFWRKMNFIKFPLRGYSESDLYHYKPLVEVNQNVTEATDDKLELWDMQPYAINGKKPRWVWHVNSNSEPVIQPCNGDWNLRLTKSGVIIKEDRVKNFDNAEDILLGPLLYLDTKKYFYESNMDLLDNE